MESALERRPWLVPASLAALCVIFFRHVLLPEQSGSGLNGIALLVDYYPRLALIQQALRGGQFPLWNPYIYTGMPFIADSQAALFYPPTLLSTFLIGPVRGAAWLLVLHVWWGAWGMRASRGGLARRSWQAAWRGLSLASVAT